MKRYFYHKIPDDMKGDILYPLNTLKQEHPSLFEKKVKKYKGREYLMQKCINSLDCLWNDVIFLSPIHPKEILQSIESIGFPKYSKSKWFRVPLEILDQEFIAVTLTKEKDTHFSLNILDKINFLSKDVKNYHKRCFQKGEKPLTFACISQVLYKGTISIQKI